MTADAFEAERRRCFEVGMNDHVAKPIEPGHLYKVLLRWLAPRGGAGEAAPREHTQGAIDVPSALRRVNGDVALLRRLFVLFERDWSDVAERLDGLLARGAHDEARHEVHKLVGVAANLSAIKLAEVTRALEHALRGPDPSEARALTRALREAVELTLRAAHELPRDERPPG